MLPSSNINAKVLNQNTKFFTGCSLEQLSERETRLRQQLYHLLFLPLLPMSPMELGS